MGKHVKARWKNAGTLVADGLSLEYMCSGPAPSEAPTIVLLHEGLGCTKLWRNFPTTLAQATGFGVFAYSRAGYGASDESKLPRPLNYMTLEAVDVLPDVLDAIDVQSAVLIGHSDGATIAAIHAGRVVDPRVVGLVVMAPHFFTETAGLAEIAKSRDAFNDGDLRARLGKYHQNPDNAFRGWNDSWLHPDFVAWNVTDVLDDIRVPVLAIQGREDPYGTLAQIDAMSDRVTQAPVTKLILDDCKHAPHLEQEAQVIAAVAAFCAQLNSNPLKPSSLS